MNLNIPEQYKYLTQEQVRLRKVMGKMAYRLLVLEKYIKHTEDIKIARKQKKLIPMEKLFHELGI